jgi:hypothetical protein
VRYADQLPAVVIVDVVSLLKNVMLTDTIPIAIVPNDQRRAATLVEHVRVGKRKAVVNRQMTIEISSSPTPA